MDRRLLYRLSVLLALMAGTVAFFSNFERYENTSPELLGNDDFSAGRERWKKTGSATVNVANGAVTIRTTAEKRNGALRQTVVVPQQRLYRLEADLRSDAVMPGPRRWETARLILVSFDSNEHQVGIEQVARLEGTHDWRHFEKVIEIPAKAGLVQVAVQMLKSIGTLEARSLSLRAVSERGDYATYRYLGIALWVAVAAWVLVPVVAKLHFGLWQAAICGILVLILAGTLMPEDVKEAAQTEIGQLLPAAIQELMVAGKKTSGALVFDYTPISKAGHFLGFALLAFLLCQVLAIRGITYALLTVVLLAGISEVLQFFVSGRTPGLRDILIDLAGAVAGVTMYLPFAGRRKD